MRTHLVLAALLWSASARAEPVVVERVVARIDGRPVFLSEIRERARTKLANQTPAQRGASFRKTYRELLEERIEQELLSNYATQRQASVASSEIENALAEIAKANSIDVDTLLTLAAAAGLDAKTYREDVRQQLLEQRVSYEFGLHALGPYPETEVARSAWLKRARRRLLSQTEGQTCIERFVRW